MFDKYVYIQSIVGAFCTVCTNRVTLDQLNDEKVWIKRLANPNNYEKGKGILVTMTSSGNYLVGPSSEVTNEPDDYTTDKLTLDNG